MAVQDPASPSDREMADLLARLNRSNAAVYVAPQVAGVEDKSIPKRLASRLGLDRLDANWLADEDAISSITPGQGGTTRSDFIPYTTQPIRWHTDGYYNPEARWIRAMVLHCVRPAATGGENAIMDHEIAYILLRDENPDWIAALSASDAMTIPPRVDAEGEARAAQSGPVFRIDDDTGDLLMRYTARTRSIVWKDDALTRQAVARLSSLLAGDAASSPYLYRLRLEAGMGLVCNNVLHDRAGFSDDAIHPPRLLYRARYYDRIVQTRGLWRSVLHTPSV